MVIIIRYRVSYVPPVRVCMFHSPGSPGSSAPDLKRKNEQVSTERDELAQKLRKVESLYGRSEWMSCIVHEKLALCMHPLR